jgi:hypothetical protein
LAATSASTSRTPPAPQPSGYFPPPPKEFTTAREFLSFHMKQFLQTMSVDKARSAAKKHLQQEVTLLVEPQWRAQARFPCCHRCGLDGHRGTNCKETGILCEYCGATTHNTVVCLVLHRFCHRCGIFGHNPVTDLNRACVGHARDQDWASCKPAGYYTCRPKFTQVVRWDTVAQDIKTKFGDLLDLARPRLPQMALYALELAAKGNSCPSAFDWFERYQKDMAKTSRKRSSTSDRHHDDADDSVSTHSKVSRASDSTSHPQRGRGPHHHGGQRRHQQDQREPRFHGSRPRSGPTWHGGRRHHDRRPEVRQERDVPRQGSGVSDEVRLEALRTVNNIMAQDTSKKPR